ncbi:MAG TPA: formate dehydrogenase [Xanthobacteraceae bacterium]|nr:formate dehydrogenase [Xanthobacteraceae bacterium]
MKQPGHMNDSATVGRRDVFRALALGAVAATGADSLATEAAADSEGNDEKRKARYRESEEVKTFYRVNRYPKR